jgi:hypothetical protein
MTAHTKVLRRRIVSLPLPPLALHGPVRTFSIAVLLSVALGSFVVPAGGAKPPPTVAHPKAEGIDGVPLVPITSRQRASCEKLANHLKKRVPCPGLLPTPIPISPTSSAVSCLGTLGESACGPAALQVTGGVFFLSQSNFKVPPGYVGVTFQQYNGATVPEQSVDGGPLGHFVFMAGRELRAYLRSGSRGNAPPVPRYCLPMKVTPAVRVHGSVATLYQCSDSRNGPGEIELLTGHDVLVWDDAGVTAEVSFHGHSQVNVDLDIAEADATALVSPTKR